jgi:hypothetical protein
MKFTTSCCKSWQLWLGFHSPLPFLCCTLKIDVDLCVRTTYRNVLSLYCLLVLWYVGTKAVISLSVCTRTHVRIGTVRMFFPFFVSDGHLCFSLIFFVILLAGRVSVCASTHVRMCSPLILAGCCLRLIYSRSTPAAFFLPDVSPILSQYPPIRHASQIPQHQEG